MTEQWDPSRFVWEQIADRITERITSGELPPGSRLPSEAELATEYGVARMTVRRSIAALRERGLVVTLHGRGTVVVDQKDSGQE